MTLLGQGGAGLGSSIIGSDLGAQGHPQHRLGRDQEQGLEPNTLEGAESPSKVSSISAPSSQVTQLHHLRASLDSGPWRGSRGCRAQHQEQNFHQKVGRAIF